MLRRFLTHAATPILRTDAGTAGVRAIVRGWMSAMDTRGPEPAARALVKLMDDLYWRVDEIGARYDEGVHVKHRLTGYHDFFVANVRPGERVLDVGCGKGELAYDLAERSGATVVGIDINTRSLDFARVHRAHAHVIYLEQDVYAYKPDDHFDVVVLSNVLEHLESRSDLLQTLAASTGAIRLLIRVPVLSRDWVVPFRRELGLPHFSDPTHVLEYEPEILDDELHQAGLRLESLERRWGELRAVAVPRA